MAIPQFDRPKGGVTAPMRWWRLGSVALTVLAACTAAGLGWEEKDACGPNGCTRCSRDEDCVAGSSCCAHTLYCSHRDDAAAVCQLGCIEPDPPPCSCQNGRCRFE
jgi:hypothetical protein